MQLKKYMGSLLLMLTGWINNVAPASALSIGLEEMPDSMKKLR